MDKFLHLRGWARRKASQSTQNTPARAVVADGSSDVAGDSTSASSRLAGHDPLLYLPAYIALALAVGAGCYALVHYITLPVFSMAVYSALAFAIVLAYALHCGPPKARPPLNLVRGI